MDNNTERETNAVATAIDNLVLALFQRGRPKTHGTSRSGIVRDIDRRVLASLERLVEQGLIQSVERSYKNADKGSFVWYTRKQVHAAPLRHDTTPRPL